MLAVLGLLSFYPNSFGSNKEPKSKTTLVMNSSQLQLKVKQVDSSPMTNPAVSETWGLRSQTCYNEHRRHMVFPGAAAISDSTVGSWLQQPVKSSNNWGVQKQVQMVKWLLTACGQWNQTVRVVNPALLWPCFQMYCRLSSGFHWEWQKVRCEHVNRETTRLKYASVLLVLHSLPCLSTVTPLRKRKEERLGGPYAAGSRREAEWRQ